ncbi:DUF1963 domain-containing protein [Pacificoceanicola onchidii]|uniref:DUF1963 domain-containing protein n=1 Tax=Pacificoceanicola onchidii TaxID=2562685 RepID=UPI0010A3BA4A|nr:DUF1963 domain-containing protein [Pacificoceanicola onchidii]
MYAARTLFLVGTGVLVFGTVWAAVIWKDLTVLLPDAFDQPYTAFALMAVGAVMSWLGKRMGGDVFDDSAPMTEFGTEVDGVVGFVKQNLGAFRRRGKDTREESGASREVDLKMQAYSDMLEDAPADMHMPREAMAPARDRKDARRKAREGSDSASLHIPPEQRLEIIAQLLSGGVKAAERFVEIGGHGEASDGAPAEQTTDKPRDEKPPQDREYSAEDLQPVKPIDFHTGRLRLEIQFPQHPTDSWIGGGPSLPEGVAWPMIGETPASFYAQIAVADLPEDIWGGVGPREGWLVIFGADSPGAEVTVLHTLERGVDRPVPDGADYYFRFASGEEALFELIGPDALLPPRWYLTAVPDEDGARPDLSVAHAETLLLDKPSMTDPGFLPFDWVTTIALVDAVDAMVERMIGRARKDAADGDDAKAGMLEGLGQTLTRVRRLSSRIEARAAEADFSERDCAKVIGALAKMTNEAWLGDAARAGGRKPLSLLQYKGFKSYRKLYEAQARRVYAMDPAALPEATLNRLLPLWQAYAAQEVIFVGNDADDKEGRLPSDAPCLLLLPPSDLAGWQIGEASRWAVQINPRDLGMGRLEKAFAANGDGQDWDK